MARLARATIAGYPHHVLQRGNYDQRVFEDTADYGLYLDLLRECTARYSVDIWAYCLMPNHIHVVCVPKVDGALARTFNTTHMRYAQHFNGKRAVTGHLWRARFMSCVLDETSVHEEVRFIETNPVRMGLVSRPEDYAWSSAKSHVKGEFDPVLTDGRFLQSANNDWATYLSTTGDIVVLARNRERLRTGRPAGDEAFVEHLESILGRRLRARPRGRPRKASSVSADKVRKNEKTVR